VAVRSPAKVSVGRARGAARLAEMRRDVTNEGAIAKVSFNVLENKRFSGRVNVFFSTRL
jgi:hypothetical protein